MSKLVHLKTTETPEYVGTVTQKNPWELLHKTRFGRPGIAMIALVTLPLDDLADLLGYSQTLPAT